MRISPSIVPQAADRDIYLVLEDFGWIGCRWRETDKGTIDGEMRMAKLRLPRIDPRRE